jgi:predicted O-methyltransferase YrrM
MDKSEEILKEIEEFAEKKFLPIIGPDKGKIMAKKIKETHPKRVLEIGTLIGYSAILIGKELTEDSCIVTIEIHKKEAKAARNNILRAQIPAKVQIINGDAKEKIPELKGPFDFVFIDAEKTEYYEYLRLTEEKIHKGTVIVADNAGIFAEQMVDYLNYVRKSGKYKSTYIQVGQDGIEISTKL